MLSVNKDDTVSSAMRPTRVDCPLCGANVTVHHLRYMHVCGRRSGRPRSSEQEQLDSAVKALIASMDSLEPQQESKPVQTEAPLREGSPLYTEYNG